MSDSVTRVREICLAPPEATEKSSGGHVRLDADHDWAELAELLRDSYRLIAPKRLAAQV